MPGELLWKKGKNVEYYFEGAGVCAGEGHNRADELAGAVAQILASMVAIICSGDEMIESGTVGGKLEHL